MDTESKAYTDRHFKLSKLTHTSAHCHCFILMIVIWRPPVEARRLILSQPYWGLQTRTFLIYALGELEDFFSSDIGAPAKTPRNGKVRRNLVSVKFGRSAFPRGKFPNSENAS